MTIPVIDVDSHLTEPADLWTSRVPARFVDRVPQMTLSGDGRDIWGLDGRQISVGGVTAPASYDAEARLGYLDEVGIWAQVLSPNVAGFGSQKFLSMDDGELKLL